MADRRVHRSFLFTPPAIGANPGRNLRGRATPCPGKNREGGISFHVAQV